MNMMIVCQCNIMLLKYMHIRCSFSHVIRNNDDIRFKINITSFIENDLNIQNKRTFEYCLRIFLEQ